jgi:hypothetical protein
MARLFSKRSLNLGRRGNVICPTDRKWNPKNRLKAVPLEWESSSAVLQRLTTIGQPVRIRKTSRLHGEICAGLKLRKESDLLVYNLGNKWFLSVGPTILARKYFEVTSKRYIKAFKEYLGS